LKLSVLESDCYQFNHYFYAAILLNPVWGP